MSLPSRIVVAVSDAHIALGQRGSTKGNPVALALAEAIPSAPGASPSSLAVFRGPSMFPNHSEETHKAEAYEYNILWQTLINGQDVPLPRRCQIFLDVWEYGPGGGALYAIRDKAGAVIARRTFCEIVTPFTFTLSERRPS